MVMASLKTQKNIERPQNQDKQRKGEKLERETPKKNQTEKRQAGH
jgi:hypothetical protein